jgi:two-component system response regulator HupR/HoxA
MINWEFLEDRHVIRKLKEIVGKFFQAEVFFLNENGVVQNFDRFDRQRKFHSPLCAEFLTENAGCDWVLQHFQDLADRAARSKDTFHVFPGPLGFDQVFTARLEHNGEVIGSVMAYAYVDHEISPEALHEATSRVAARGLSVDGFHEAVKRLKPLSHEKASFFRELVDVVAREITTYCDEKLKGELETQQKRTSYDQMRGHSKVMNDLYAILDKISASEATVLVQGENGTGKELIARSIHAHSPRSTQAFVTVNCSALTETLLDSELFGHVKGSFTGAIKDKKGLFESAHKGTLFLDEVGDMSLTMQVKLLRVLQQGTLIPVGGTEERKVDVRVIAATNRDLKGMIEEGTFREDLYYRINVINIQVPALRDRKEDLKDLVKHFLESEHKKSGQAEKRLSETVFKKFYDYNWPGNIRQLENEIERLVVLSGADVTIGPELLSPALLEASGSASGGSGKGFHFKFSGKLKDAMQELERTMIKEGLRRTKWNKSKLAKELGISRAGLIGKVEKYGLDKRKLAREGGGGEAA